MGEVGDLIERVRGLTGPDREVDALVEVIARGIEAKHTGLAREHRAKWRASRTGWVSDGFTTYKATPITASVDAVLALIERVRPGCCALMAITPEKTTVTLHDTPLGEVGIWHPMAEMLTAPLALLLALLLTLPDAPRPTGEQP